jgi:hypothetical protein
MLLLLLGTGLLGVVLTVVVLLGQRGTGDRRADGQRDTRCDGWNTSGCHRRGSKDLCRRPRLRGKLDLFKLQIIVNGGEGRERPPSLEKGHHVGEMNIEIMKHGKHEGSVQDNLSQVTKCIGHPL